MRNWKYEEIKDNPKLMKRCCAEIRLSEALGLSKPISWEEMREIYKETQKK